MNEFQQVVYLNETWVNQNYTLGYIWQNLGNTKELKVPIGKGGRLIVCHAGLPSFGFVKKFQKCFSVQVK